MKEQQAKIIPEGIHITLIQIFKAGLETSPEFLDQPVEVESFSVDVGYELAHNVADEMVRLQLFFTIKGIDPHQNNMPIGLAANYGIEFNFKVENLNNFMQEEEPGNPLMQLDLAATLLSMAYSTSRGIILGRTQGTFFGGVIIPVIDPFKVLTSTKEENQAN